MHEPVGHPFLRTVRTAHFEERTTVNQRNLKTLAVLANLIRQRFIELRLAFRPGFESLRIKRLLTAVLRIDGIRQPAEQFRIRIFERRDEFLKRRVHGRQTGGLSLFVQRLVHGKLRIAPREGEHHQMRIKRRDVARDSRHALRRPATFDADVQNTKLAFRLETLL